MKAQIEQCTHSSNMEKSIKFDKRGKKKNFLLKKHNANIQKTKYQYTMSRGTTLKFIDFFRLSFDYFSFIIIIHLYRTQSMSER